MKTLLPSLTLIIITILLLSALGSTLGCAKEPAKQPPPPTIESLQAEVALLKAQLAEFQTIFQLEQQVCSAPELMRARLARIDAAAKAAKTTEAKPKQPTQESK